MLRVQTTKLEENQGVKFYDHRVDSGFLDTILKSQVTEEKYKLDFIKIKYTYARNTTEKVKRINKNIFN